MILSVVYLLVGFLVVLLAAPRMIRLAERGVGIDEADEGRKSHVGVISRLGGVPIMLAVTVALVSIVARDPFTTPDWLPILLGSALMFALGLWDDLRRLPARAKLAAQLGIAVLMYYLGLHIELITYPGSTASVELGAWSLPVTVFWLIAVPNIINLIDGFDGLASGLGLFMAVTLGIVGLFAGQLPIAHYSFALAGAMLGFLMFNFPPARIFLGDGGAYLIGFSIASLSLTSSHKGSVGAVLAVTVVALGIPILDTSLAMLRRALRGYPIFHADDEHIHHRLQHLGFSKRRIILGLYGVCVVLSLMGLSIVWSRGRTIPIAVAAMFCLAIVALRYLRYIPSFSTMHHSFGRTLGRRRGVQYALLQARVLEMEIERCEDSREFWEIFDQTLRRVGFVDHRTSGHEDCYPVHLRYNGSKPLELCAPRGDGSNREWQRVAECFRPVYIKAVSKWRT